MVGLKSGAEKENTAEGSNSLKRDQVGLFGLVFLAMGSLGAVAIFSSAISGAASTALGETALSFVIGMLVALLAANTIFQYSKRVYGASGYYGYVRDGLGKHTSVFTAYLYLFYGVFNISFLVLVYAWTFSGSVNLVLGSSLPDWTGYIFVAIVLIFSYIFVYLGLKPSVTFLAILGLISIGVVVVVSAVFIARIPAQTLLPFEIQKTPGVTGLFLGVVTGSYLSYAGYGTVVSLGKEAKTPSRTIGLATVLVLLIAGGYYAIGTYSQTVLWGLNNIGALAASGYSGAILAQKYVDSASAAVIIFLYNFVMFTPIIAFFTSISRVIYAMSSENIFPKSFSKLKRGVPVRGLTLAFGLVTLVSLVLGGVFIAEYGFFNGLFDAWLICVTTATVSALIVHALANVALFNSARKNKIRNFLTHYVLPAGSTLFIFIVLFYSLMGISYPLIIAPIIVVIFIILIAGYVAIKRQLFLKLPEAAP